MHRFSHPIERRDAHNDEKNRAYLLNGSGLTKVPCLQSADQSGLVQWLSGSKEIISYLQGRF